MYVPKGDPPIRISSPAQTLFLAIGGLVVAVAAWGIVSLRSAGNQPDRTAATPFDPADVDSVAFLTAGAQTDDLVIHTPGTERPPRVMARFERPGSAPARGKAAPQGDRIAVVHADSSGTTADVTIVTIGSDTRITASPGLDPSTPIAWSPGGDDLVAAASTPPDDGGRQDVTLVRVNAHTGVHQPVTRFEGVFNAVPVGYSLDSSRLFVVVVDQSGSSLWAIEDGEQVLVSELSAGRTRDWLLSPDGSMLAFIEIRSGSGVPSVGRTVFTANGAPLPMGDSPTAHEGVAWRPGSHLPGFGGPGGSVRLDTSTLAENYLIPEGWSPDGSALIARVVQPSEDAETSAITWEVLANPAVDAADEHRSVPSRAVLYEGPVAVSFLGWVQRASTSSVTVQE